MEHQRCHLLEHCTQRPLGLSQVLLTTHLNRSLGIPDEAFVLGDSAVLAALGQVAFMPTLVLAAKLCPPGAEGTLFASLMSIYNFSGTVASELGALLTSAFWRSRRPVRQPFLISGRVFVERIAASPFYRSSRYRGRARRPKKKI